MQQNERTRRSWWEYKHSSGQKRTQVGFTAKPFNGAADHDVFLTQAVLNKRNAMRLAAVSAGALSVTPTEATDSAQAALMKQVLRYYLAGPMKSEMLTQAVRAGSYADRYRFSLMYVGWKEERGVEPVKITFQQLVGWWQEKQMQEMTAGMEGMQELPEMPDYTAEVVDPGNLDALVELVLAANPGLAQRKAEGRRQAIDAVKTLQKSNISSNESATVYAAYVKKSCPTWEALEPFVDVFLPAETWNEPNLDSCRWIARVRWRNAQWIKEQAAIHDWNPKWVKEVLDNHKGRSKRFATHLSSTWALSGGAVNWSTRPSNESQNHLYQIVELWDRSITTDGLTGTYHTIMHADVGSMVAKRELRADWDGMYPFVPFTFSMDEKLLLGGLSVPEVTKTTQHAVKAQYDSRTDAAALTTYPTWTGDHELQGLNISPGKFVPTLRGNKPEAIQFPAADGRSIEIEKSLRNSVDEFFGFAGPTVPDSMAMVMSQAMVDWFMNGVSSAVARSARLLQQYMSPLKGARIATGYDAVTATAEEVRGSFDYSVAFSVKSLDMEWLTSYLTVIKDMALPLDNRGYSDTLPLLESAFNMVDPNLASRMLPKDNASNERKTEDEARRDIAQIFTGSPLPKITPGMNFGGMAEAARAEIVNSPDRMNAVIGGQQLHQVLTAYFSGLVNNTQQYGGENAQIGRTLQKDPLAPQSEAQKFLALLESLPDGASLAQWSQYQQQAQPMGMGSPQQPEMPAS